LIIETLETTVAPGLMTNCYLVADKETKEGVIIDPGGSPELILRRVEELGLKIVHVINTHAHFDHIAANQPVADATGAKVAGHVESLPLYRMQGGAALFGLRMPATQEPDLLLKEGDLISFGRNTRNTLRVLHTPGHTPGCISLWSEGHQVVFDGDLLFNAGIGRTDLPGGDYRQLMKSIQEKILTLPDECVVYPGHGPHTTVGQERRMNPYLETRRDWT